MDDSDSGIENRLFLRGYQSLAKKAFEDLRIDASDHVWQQLDVTVSERIRLPGIWGLSRVQIGSAEGVSHRVESS